MCVYYVCTQQYADLWCALTHSMDSRKTGRAKWLWQWHSICRERNLNVNKACGGIWWVLRVTNWVVKSLPSSIPTTQQLTRIRTSWASSVQSAAILIILIPQLPPAYAYHSPVSLTKGPPSSPTVKSTPCELNKEKTWILRMEEEEW